MQEINLQEQDNSEVSPISEEDGLLTIKIFRKALELRPLIVEAIVGEKFLQLSREERLTETLTRRVCFYYADTERKIPVIFFRFVGDVMPSVETTFYPFETIHFFLEEARSIANKYCSPERTDEEKQAGIFNHTLEMTLVLIDCFYQRAELMMDFLPFEVLGQWHRNKNEEFIHSNAERGDAVKPYKHPLLDISLNNYKKEIAKYWKYQGRAQDNWRKVWLYDEYTVLFRHWWRLSKMNNDEDADWCDYAKAGKFSDTPDDLLKKLGDTERLNEEAAKTKVSELALEHAARRSGCIKKYGVNQYIQQKRAEGIKITGYSTATLFGFLQEGKNIKTQLEENKKLLQIEITPNFAKEDKSALVKKQKLLEQNIKFAQDNIENSNEQTTAFALIKKE